MKDWWEKWFSDLDRNGANSFNNMEAQRGDIIMRQHPETLSSCRTQTQTHHHSMYSSNCLDNLGFKGQNSGPHLGTKRIRSSSEIQDHVMAERKRRQEMAERFIALSAMIPGLKKIDKASVLGEAINYVKQLQERIAVLEEEGNKKKKSTTNSLILIKKSQSYPHNSDDSDQVLPEVEAIGLDSESEKELLIRIHCEKRKGILLKLLALLENVHLSVASSNVLPFGKNTLNITIIAQMGEEYKLTGEELVKVLREGLLK
ncbi:transcription factor bHLH25-like [Lotus japonicus]|uniref:transcription factor bHLH25-like n=1 Tax=Lotus japonicus TaxID=34305 RepID=UPI002584FE80|nr:transcription factor bHLH25-like [Lotus japonicus]